MSNPTFFSLFRNISFSSVNFANYSTHGCVQSVAYYYSTFELIRRLISRENREILGTLALRDFRVVKLITCNDNDCKRLKVL